MTHTGALCLEPYLSFSLLNTRDKQEEINIKEVGRDEKQILFQISHSHLIDYDPETEKQGSTLLKSIFDADSNQFCNPKPLFQTKMHRKFKQALEIESV